MPFPSGPIIWPECMTAIVRDFPDERAIWDAGLEALGYPPNWSRSIGEAHKVRERLKETFVPF